MIPSSLENVNQNILNPINAWPNKELYDKEAKEFDSRNIRFIAHYSLGTELDYTFRMGLIEKMGFSTIFDKNLCGQYPQDGVVYRIDNWKRCNQLGYTSKYPRFAVALKETLENDEGTIFRYSNHENTVMRQIYRQIENDSEIEAFSRKGL